jgi:hypothetical protein
VDPSCVTFKMIPNVKKSSINILLIDCFKCAGFGTFSGTLMRIKLDPFDIMNVDETLWKALLSSLI